MRVAFFGSSLISAYWNGAATYYRGLLRALDARGFRTTFFEPDAYERLAHRDIPDPPWARVRVYPATRAEVDGALDEARGADLIVKASGVGVFDEYLEAAILSLKRPGNVVAFWDVDAPATLTRLANDSGDPFAQLVSRYDLVFTYGGGRPVVEAYQAYGARACIPIYNAVDPTTHHPVAAKPEFGGTLSFLGNRLPDREDRVREFFFGPALRLGSESFIIGGSGWDPESMPSNVRNLGHVYTHDHNAFYASPRAVLNVSRQSMATFGYSPATRVFEAAGAGACLISDAWEGIELFLEPQQEVLVANSGDDVVAALSSLDERKARTIGRQALARVLAHHTYEQRALEVESALAARGRGSSVASVTNGGGGHAALPASAPVMASTPVTASEREDALTIVMLGLSITSTWGNGHATTYRALVRELARQGHRVLFLEHDKPWYAQARDLLAWPFCRTELYASFSELQQRFGTAMAEADLVVVGSFVPEGIAVGEWVTGTARGVTAFYDIDTPVTLAGLQADTCDYQSAELIPRYDMYLSFTGGPTLETLERRWGAQRALPLYCSVDPEIYFPESQALLWDLGYMGTYSEDRQAGLERLMLNAARSMPHARFVVAGSGYPEELCWPGSVEQLGHLPAAEHRRFYNQQRFTLNITRREMIAAGFSPSVRLFEAAACGTPILTDRWSGLAHFFTIGEELLVVDDTRDVVQALTGLSESERAAIGARARARVLREHTAAHRARTLVRYAKRVARETRDSVKARSA